MPTGKFFALFENKSDGLPALARARQFVLKQFRQSAPNPIRHAELVLAAERAILEVLEIVLVGDWRYRRRSGRLAHAPPIRASTNTVTARTPTDIKNVEAVPYDLAHP